MAGAGKPLDGHPHRSKRIEQPSIVIPRTVDAPAYRPSPQHGVVGRRQQLLRVASPSPSHSGQLSDSKTTGIRSCTSRAAALAMVVMIVKYLIASRPDAFQMSTHAGGQHHFREPSDSGDGRK
jgi:hypothetical protein